MKKIYILLLFTFLAVLVLDLYFTKEVKTLSPTATPQTLGAISKTGPDALYPNPSITPGEIFPNATKEQVCISGYSATVRNVPIKEKKRVFEEYGLNYPQPTGAYEVDHFISLELGGDNSIQNLWPEPANPVPGFHQKDVVENYLHKQVCDGVISLEEAQNEIKTDWYKVYQSLQ
jgi:hypothetical protein